MVTVRKILKTSELSLKYWKQRPKGWALDAEPFGLFDRYFYCSGVRGINRRSLAGLLLQCKLFRFWRLDWFSEWGSVDRGLTGLGAGFGLVPSELARDGHSALWAPFLPFGRAVCRFAAGLCGTAKAVPLSKAGVFFSTL